ncbi:MAG: ATP-binding protein [Micropruina glycogenica]
MACLAGLVAGIVFAVLMASIPSAETRAMVTTLFLLGFGVLAAVLAIWRTGLSVGRLKRAWLILSIGLCLGISSNLISLGLLPGEALILVDPLLMVALLCSLVALMLFPTARRRRADLIRLVMDGLVVGGSVLFMGSATIFPTLLAKQDGSLGSQVQILALPVLDLVIATAAILLIARSAAQSRTPLILVGVAFLLYSVSDMAYAVNVSVGAAGLGSWWDLGWMGGYFFLSLAALHPDPAEPVADRSAEPSAVRSTFVFFGIFLAAAATNMLAEARGELDIGAWIVWGFLLLVVVTRQIVLVMDNEYLRRSLEVRVQARTRELRAITHQREMLLSSVADGIYGVDRAGTITMVNGATVSLLGRSERSLIGANAHDLFHAPQEDGVPYPYDNCYIAEATRSGVTVTGEEDVYVRGDGRTMVVEVTASPLRADDEVRGAVVVFRDVSQRREMDRMKQEFVSVVSHELRTPSPRSAGRSACFPVERTGHCPRPRHGCSRSPPRAASDSEKLVNDILEVERLDTGMLPLVIKSQAVEAACQETIVTMSGMAQSSQISLSAPDVSGWVLADKDRLVQVLINLVGNAIRFSDPGDAVRICAQPRGDVVEISVADTGRGIPAEKLDSVFDRFSQVDSTDARERGGTGLGLAICRGLVERMGGRIWVESELGVGSTFRLELPAGAQPEATTTEPALANDAQPQAT